MLGTALVINGVLLAGATYLKFGGPLRRKMKIKSNWNRIMEESKIQSKKSQQIPLIVDIKFIENGYMLKVTIPSGLSIKDLENIRESIESNLKAIITIEKVRFSSLVKIKVIEKEINYKFGPVVANEKQIYIGKKFDGTDYFLDITKACHILIAGATGTGKTFLLGSILTNLIHNSSDRIELHLYQVMKGEVGLFRECKPVKFTGTSIEEVAYDLNKLSKLVDSRSKKFTSLGVKNLDHYNKHYTKSKMKRVYCILEEMSFLMPSDEETEEVKKMKKECWNDLLTIVKAGRSSGIHLISLTQRSTVTNLPSDLKSQMARITFKQISSIDSRNIIECDLATELKEMECLCYGTGETMEIIKTPYIDEDFKVLNKYVEEIIVPFKKKKEESRKRSIDYNTDSPRELPLYIPNKILEFPVESNVEKPVETNKFTKVKKGMIKIAN